jgi:transcription elongation factor GreB
MVPKKNNYITPAGYERLMHELQQLLRRERPEITQLIQWAASNGDRSENADYLYGRRRLREIDRRIRFLTQRLEASVVIDPAAQDFETIQFGATIEILDDEGVARIISIVGVDEVDTARGRISWQSPIGRSLLGKKVGDEIQIQVPAGEKSYEVVSICYKTILGDML